MMGIDQLPFLPTRRRSLTLNPNSISDDNSVVATLNPNSIFDDNSGVATRPLTISTPMECNRRRSGTQYRNKERVSRKDLSTNYSCSSSLCSRESNEEMSRSSGRDKESSRRKSRTHSTIVRQRPKSLTPSRSQSFDGVTRRRLSPRLPTVQEFQRANFEHEDEQVLESLRRSRSWSDVRECRNQYKHTKNVRLSPRNRNRSVLETTIAKKNGVLTEPSELSKSRRFDPENNDHRLVSPPSSMHPKLDINDVGVDKKRELMQISPITRLKTGQTSQERLQATIHRVEEELYHSYNSKYVTAWPRQLNHNNNERDHAAMTGLVAELYQVETIGDTKSMSQPVKIRRPKSSDPINRCQSMPFLTKTESDVEFHNILGMPLLRYANESRPHSSRLLANRDEKIPSPRSITCMLPAGATRPAFGDSEKAFGGNMALVTTIPKNMAAPISPERVSSPLLIKRKSV
jgi:hypothetical protein